MSLKCGEGEVSGQTMVARYIPLLRLLSSYLGRQNSRLAQQFCCWDYIDSDERQDAYEEYIPRLLNTSGGGYTKLLRNLFYMNNADRQKCREDEEEDVSSYWMALRKRKGTGN